MKRLGPNYWKLWTASVTSNFGDGVSTVAYPWLASAVTRNPIQIALIGVAARLPWLVFTLPAGVITDRVDRKRLIVAMDLLRFAITATVAAIVATVGSDLTAPGSLASGSVAGPDHRAALLLTLYGSALAFGFAEVLRDNAAQTILPAVVDSDLLETANGRMWGAEMVMNSFIGPPLAGILIAVSFSLPFFVDAATFAAAAALVFLIAGEFKPKNDVDDVSEVASSFWGDLKEGVRWLWNHPLFRPMAIALGVLNGTMMMTLATFVLFAQEILDLDATRFGLLTTGVAVGGVIGSFVAHRVAKALGQGGSLFASILVMAVSLVVSGLTSSFWVFWAMGMVSALAGTLWNVITVSLRQALIPDRILGRVNSVYRFIGWGIMPIGSALGGVVVAVIEPGWGREWALRAPFLLAGVLTLVIFVYALPRLNSARIDEAKEKVST